jgi:hypothetical protein
VQSTGIAVCLRRLYERSPVTAVRRLFVLPATTQTCDNTSVYIEAQGYTLVYWHADMMEMEIKDCAVVASGASQSHLILHSRFESKIPTKSRFSVACVRVTSSTDTTSRFELFSYSVSSCNQVFDVVTQTVTTIPLESRQQSATIYVRQPKPECAIINTRTLHNVLTRLLV